MRSVQTFLYLGLATATMGSLCATQAPAQSLAASCSAFARHANGDWRVLAPVMLSVNGKLFAPTVGTTLVAGKAANGLRISEILDRQCSMNTVKTAPVPENAGKEFWRKS